MPSNNYCAYVAINTEPKSTKEVFRKLQETRGVKTANTISGPYDILVRLEADTHRDAFNTVLSEIRCFPGVQHTETWTCWE